MPMTAAADRFERSFEMFCQQMNKQMLELATQEKGADRDQGYCIGSGAIEAAHRHVFQRRPLGVRSNSPGSVGQHRGVRQVANLRVAHPSNQWHRLQNAVRKAA